MNIKHILLITILILLLGCTSKIIIPNENPITIKVEIAQTPEEQQIGLMNKKSLKPNTGMLFIFDQERSLQFWMKNMSFPIDIIFLNNDFKIIDIKHNFRPCKFEPCPAYVPKKPAKYALEVNAEFAKNHNIKINNTLIFKK